MIAQGPQIDNSEGFFDKRNLVQILILRFLKRIQQFNNIYKYCPYFIYERTSKKPVMTYCKVIFQACVEMEREYLSVSSIGQSHFENIKR